MKATDICVTIRRPDGPTHIDGRPGPGSVYGSVMETGERLELETVEYPVARLDGRFIACVVAGNTLEIEVA